MTGSIVGSYMDESFDPLTRTGARGVFAVGGLMGAGVPFFELERRWKGLRQRSDINIRYFKASECERGKGEFSKFVVNDKDITQAERVKLDSISREFRDLIIKPVKFDPKQYLFIFGVGVVQADFYAITGENAKAHAILGSDPYRLAYDFAMIQCAWAMKQARSGDRVSFVCDQHETYSNKAEEAYHNLKNNNPDAAAYMASFSFKDDKACEQLQAADAAVFEVRRALNHTLGQWPGHLRHQFKELADSGAMSLITLITKEQLAHLVSTHEPGKPLKLDSLMDLQLNENISLDMK